MYNRPSSHAFMALTLGPAENAHTERPQTPRQTELMWAAVWVQFLFYGLLISPNNSLCS